MLYPLHKYITPKARKRLGEPDETTSGNAPGRHALLVAACLLFGSLQSYSPHVVHAQEPTMLTDLTPGSIATKQFIRGAGGSGLVRFAGDAYCLGTSYISSHLQPLDGLELWKVDAATDTYELVRTFKEDAPETTLERTDLHVISNGMCFFTELALWVSDGTADGTVMVRDFFEDRTEVRALATSPDHFYFSLRDETKPSRDPEEVIQHTELWRTDGTPEGTVLVKDFYADGAFTISQVWIADTNVYIKTDALSGPKLWCYDTITSQIVVCDETPWLGIVHIVGKHMFGQSAGQVPSPFGPPRMVYGGLKFYDGTENGASILQVFGEGAEAQEFVHLNGSFYFKAYHSSEAGSPSRVWKTDGTNAGTEVLFETELSIGDIISDGLAVYFTANQTGQTHQGIWKTDGTIAGTTQIFLDANGSYNTLEDLTKFGGKLFFKRGPKLWCFDETNTQGMMVEAYDLDGNPLPDYTVDGSAHVYDSNVYYSTYQGGYELDTDVPSLRLKYNYMSSGLIKLGDGFYYSGARSWNQLNEHVIRKSAPHGQDMVILSQKVLSGHDSNPIAGAFLNGKYFYATIDAAIDTVGQHHVLLATNGTVAGTSAVYPVDSSPNVLAITEYTGSLFFVTSEGYGRSLIKSDGTAAGATTLYSFPLSGGNQRRFEIFNGKIYATGVSGVLASDGTADGTKVIANSGGGTLGASHSTLYVGYMGLWKLNEAGDGLVFVHALRYDDDKSALPDHFCTVSGKTYFLAATPVSEIWATDGTGPGTAKVDLGLVVHSNLVELNNRLYFAASETTSEFDSELWTSDGTVSGTHRVADIRPGLRGSGITELYVLNGSLYFGADDGVHGNEIFRSDGTSAGTELVCDVLPGPRGSYPQQFAGRGTEQGDQLYFSADTDDGIAPEPGRELFNLVVPTNSGVNAWSLYDL